MTDPAGAQRIREQQTRHWTCVAGGWAAWRQWMEWNFRPVTDWFAERARWVPGTRVVDVACGAGYPALAAAARVAPGGTVIASDIAPAMTAATAAAAAAAGLDNVVCRAMDAEHLDLPDASADAVTNAYGLMFCPDPACAVREAYRVLKPGGRIAIVTWDQASKSPFFTVITPVGANHLSLAPPEPDAPGPFRFTSADGVEALLRGAGFVDVRVDSVPMPLEFESVDQYFQIFIDVAWKPRVTALSAPQLKAFRDDVDRAVQPHLVDGRLRLVATSLCASGRKH